MKKITLLMLIIFMTITVQAQNKLLSSIQEYNSNGTWEKTYGANYEYDSNNNLIKETGVRMVDGVWNRSSISTYAYNASNKVTQDTYEDWDPDTNEVDYKGRTNYSYTSGRLILLESQEWVGSNWLNESKITASYNSDNLPDVVIEYDWINSQWVNEERTTYTYNANGKIISSVFEEWLGSQWVNSRKTVYTYDVNNKLILSREAVWDDFNANWAANGEKDELEWDASGNKTSETYFNSNSSYKTEYTYDVFAMMSSFIHPFKDKTGFDYLDEGGFPYVNKLLTETSNGGNNRTVYNYNSALTLSIDAPVVTAKKIKIYPNPTTDFLNIQNESNTSIDKITVTDLTGRKVLDQKNTTQVNVQNLAKGLYFIEAVSGKEKMVSKFVKE